MSYTIIQLMDSCSNLMKKKEITMNNEVHTSQVDNTKNIKKKDDNKSNIEHKYMDDHRMDLLFSNINGL